MSERFGINVSNSSSSNSAAVPASSARVSAKRPRQSSPAKRSKHRTDEVGEIETELIETPQTDCAVSQAEDALSRMPPELLAIIIKKLDTTSITNLHNTCRHLRNVVHMPGVVKKLDFSLSTLTTVKTKLDIFHDISGHVKVLNLSGVYDLDLPTLIRALEHMESLVDLDVSYTNITLSDFLQFRKIRPKLKSLAINYSYGLEEEFQVCEEDVLEYQRAFEGFRAVHFVCPGEYQRVYPVGKAAILILLKACLFRFTLSFVRRGDCDIYQEETNDRNETGAMRAAQFQMHLLQGQSSGVLQVLQFMEVEKCEIIIIMRHMLCNTQVLATPLVKKIIRESFAAKVGHLPETTPFSLVCNKLDRQGYQSNEMFLMFWHRERNQFKSEFRSELLSIFKEYCVFSVSSNTLTQVPPEFKWHRMSHIISSALSSLELNYGEAFKEKRDIKLLLYCYPDNKNDGLSNERLESLGMKNNYDFLKKISHLSVTIRHYGHHYDSSFFNHVFEHCESLVTFQITSRRVDPMLLQSVRKSNSLKNIYIEGNELDLRPTFIVLSECRALERFVYSVRTCGYVESLPNPNELFRKCGNLYYICIQANIKKGDDRSRDAVLTIYNEAKSALGRDALTIDIIDVSQHQYTPYMNVFNVFQLKPI